MIGPTGAWPSGPAEPPGVPAPGRRRLRRDRGGLDARAGPGERRVLADRARRAGRRISGPRRRGSSTCSCTAARATSRRSTPSPTSSAWPASRCRPASGRSPPAGKVAHNPLLATRRTFRKCGQSGLEISDFLPHLAECADDLAVIRSCWADSVNHPAGRLPDEHRLDPDGQAEPGELGQLRPGHREPGPARVRRPARPRRRHQGRPAGLRRRLPAGQPPGDRRCAAAIAADPRPGAARGDVRRSPARGCST